MSGIQTVFPATLYGQEPSRLRKYAKEVERDCWAELLDLSSSSARFMIRITDIPTGRWDSARIMFMGRTSRMFFEEPITTEAGDTLTAYGTVTLLNH